MTVGTRTPTCGSSLDDTAAATDTLRGEGRRVFSHCVAGANRTPTVAAACLVLVEGIPASEALERVSTAVPHHKRHNTSFLEALEHL